MPTLPRDDAADGMVPRRDGLPAGVKVVRAVAAELDEPPRSLEPLATCFDPEALHRFLESAMVPTRITVDVYGCTIELLDDGTVTVRRVGDPDGGGT